MRFRFHRGSFTEAMKTQIEVDSKQELIDHIDAEYYPYAIVEELRFKHLGIFDPRNGWDTYYVSVKFKHPFISYKKGFHLVGMSDGLIE